VADAIGVASLAHCHSEGPLHQGGGEDRVRRAVSCNRAPVQHHNPWRERGDVIEATEIGGDHLRRLRSLAEATHEQAKTEVTGMLALGEAEYSRLTGRSDPAAWLRAAAAWSVFPMSYEEAYARWRAGAALLATREAPARKRAAEELRRAHEIAGALKAAGLVADIERIAARGRLRLTDEPPTRPSAGEAFDLTSRERDVLGLLAAGQTNREISAALFISEKTAGSHVSSILAKLGVARRTEAAAVAHRRGLIEDASASASADVSRDA